MEIIGESEVKNINDKRYNETDTCDVCKRSLVFGKTYKEYDKSRKWNGKTYKEYDKSRKWNGKYLCNICYSNKWKYNTADKNEIKNIKLNRTETCDICGNELIIHRTRRECYIDGNCTGRWLCDKCYQKNDPNSNHNIIKSLRDHRTNNLDPNSNSAKGDNFEELTCRWRSTVSTVPVENLNKKLDNYTTPIDHSWDSELGIPQTKGCLYNHLERRWYQGFKNLHNAIANGFEFHVLILYCVGKDGKTIERIYIFPLEEIINRSSISIYKNPDPSKGTWTKDYRVKDENVIKKVNDIWKQIIGE